MRKDLLKKAKILGTFFVLVKMGKLYTEKRKAAFEQF
jgi:hypothetical protein